ncbi:DUF3127 domain-containing protein [Psychroserpens jangbogonensis]|uniref:DUF3127 domain-containing protein n=1 Tax=Psychroserpens jangbogonensis TaxID=1484460 RepID=UPI00053F0B83|nr:DUF3127 domain-containing protein [Psychroserpens jangbogonensis]
MEITGEIKKINETQTFGSNEFQKRELVITTKDQYPQILLVEFVQDKCSLLNNYNIGDEVTVSINIRGKEWLNPEGKVKYFNTFQGWKINKTTTKTTTSIPPMPPFGSDEDTDLPF